MQQAGGDSAWSIAGMIYISRPYSGFRAQLWLGGKGRSANRNVFTGNPGGSRTTRIEESKEKTRCPRSREAPQAKAATPSFGASRGQPLSVAARIGRGAGLAGGCTRLTGPGALVRRLADSPEVLRKTHFEIWNVARKALFGQEATPLRKF